MGYGIKIFVLRPLHYPGMSPDHLASRRVSIATLRLLVHYKYLSQYIFDRNTVKLKTLLARKKCPSNFNLKIHKAGLTAFVLSDYYSCITLLIDLYQMWWLLKELLFCYLQFALLYSEHNLQDFFLAPCNARFIVICLSFLGTGGLQPAG